MKLNNNQQAFLELLRAGLWEKEARLSQYKDIDFAVIMQLSEDQFVVGLVTAGLERVSDVIVPKEMLLQFIGSTLQVEQRNRDMNIIVARLIEELRNQNVYTLLIKGQGIAQCYEKPLWRVSGDVDLLLSKDNYEAAKSVLMPLASYIDEEIEKKKHLALTINNWTVELHGSLRTNLWKRLELLMDELQRDVFYNGNVRSWINGKTQVFLLRADEDAVFVFAHILQHFFIEGIGLRQICDWCRLLWTYRDSLNHGLLESRIKKAGLMSEWKAFVAFAVEYLGMPKEAMPLYDSSGRWIRNAKVILALVMENGNFGQGKNKSYKQKYPKLISYAISFGLHAKDGFRRFRMFPAEALLMWWKLMIHGLRGVLKVRRR